MCTHAPPEFTTYNITSHKGGFYSVLGRGANAADPLSPASIHLPPRTSKPPPFERLIRVAPR